MCYKQKCKVVSLNLAHPVYGYNMAWEGMKWPRPVHIPEYELAWATI